MTSRCLPPCCDYPSDQTKPMTLRPFRSKWWKCGIQDRGNCPSHQAWRYRSCQRGTLGRGLEGSSCWQVSPFHRVDSNFPERYTDLRSLHQQWLGPTLHSSSRILALEIGRRSAPSSSMATCELWYMIPPSPSLPSTACSCTESLQHTAGQEAMERTRLVARCKSPWTLLPPRCQCLPPIPGIGLKGILFFTCILFSDSPIDSTHEDSAKCSLEGIRIHDSLHTKVSYLAAKNLVIESNLFLSEYLATLDR